MHFDGFTAAIMVVIFVSSLVRTVFGFGNALVAMPLLALAGMGMKTATPLVALVSLLLGIAILLQNWKSMDVRSAWRLLAATAAGIPIGTIIVKSAWENVGEILLALIIIGFSGYSLTRPKAKLNVHKAKLNVHKLIEPKNDWLAYPFGFIAGILGGAWNSNGPPVVIYGALRRWRPDELRATLQGYFLPSSVIIVAGHGLGGLWTPVVLHDLLLSLPAALFALLLGRRLHRMITPGQFDSLIHATLIIIGLLLLTRAIFV